MSILVVFLTGYLGTSILGYERGRRPSQWPAKPAFWRVIPNPELWTNVLNMFLLFTIRSNLKLWSMFKLFNMFLICSNSQPHLKTPQHQKLSDVEDPLDGVGNLNIFFLFKDRQKLRRGTWNWHHCIIPNPELWTNVLNMSPLFTIRSNPSILIPGYHPFGTMKFWYPGTTHLVLWHFGTQVAIVGSPTCPRPLPRQSPQTWEILIPGYHPWFPWIFDTQVTPIWSQ